MEWVKPVDCEGGACVELTWVTPTECDDETPGFGKCVQVATDGTMIGIRNSNVPGEIVWFDRETEWLPFQALIRSGEFAA